jgi:hypothetical protein
MQRRGKYASTTIKLLLQAVLSIRTVQTGYKEDK